MGEIWSLAILFEKKDRDRDRSGEKRDGERRWGERRFPTERGVARFAEALRRFGSRERRSRDGERRERLAGDAFLFSGVRLFGDSFRRFGDVFSGDLFREAWRALVLGLGDDRASDLLGFGFSEAFTVLASLEALASLSLVSLVSLAFAGRLGEAFFARFLGAGLLELDSELLELLLELLRGGTIANAA